MKTGFVKCKAGFLGLLFGLGLSAVANAAVGFSISPSIITNDFVGEVTLTITNLTPGQTVTVGFYADLNGNGIIETNDPLGWSFPLTDGQVPLVAGVRNLNIPGDEDGLANGQIRAVIYVPPDAGGLVAAGKSIVKVSDPLGGFSPVTQPFTVVPRIYPQSVTGRLTLAATGLPLTNTVVAVANVNVSDTLFTTTDTNGNYTATCLPGSYVVEAYNPGIGVIYSQTLVFSIACGQTVTNNLALTNGNFTISGRVTDSSTGAGISGLSVDANTSGNLAALTLHRHQRQLQPSGHAQYLEHSSQHGRGLAGGLCAGHADERDGYQRQRSEHQLCAVETDRDDLRNVARHIKQSGCWRPDVGAGFGQCLSRARTQFCDQWQL